MREYSISDDLYQEISRLKYLSESLVKLCKNDNPFTYLGFELGRDVAVLNEVTTNLNKIMREIEATEIVETKLNKE